MQCLLLEGKETMQPGLEKASGHPLFPLVSHPSQKGLEV